MTSEERKEIRYQRRRAARLAAKEKRTRAFDDFDKVFSYKNLYKSYRMCKRGVRWKASTQKYIANAPLYVYDTFCALRDDKFKSKGFYEFDLYERGKARHIKSVEMLERVVQRCLCDYSLVPMLRRTFIYDNGASMKYKGYTFAVKRINRHLKRHIRKHGNNGYALLFDFSSYFDSIPHELIWKILEKQYTDMRLIALIKHFVEMFGERGLGLGSQVSQILALAAASELDHFIKEELGITCYGRYMDDGYLIHESKEYLQYCLERIRAKCEELGLKLSEKKTHIVPIKRDFGWLKIKFRITDSGHIVKRIWTQSVLRMRRKLKKFKDRVKGGLMTLFDVYQSYQSWRSHTHGLSVYKTLKRMDELFFTLFHWRWNDELLQSNFARQNYRCA